MIEETYYYDLIDDGGINSIELPIKIHAGSFFTCEYGVYEVIEGYEEVPESYTNILCERVEKP